MMIKYRVSNVAKDFEVPGKRIVTLLEEKLPDGSDRCFVSVKKISQTPTKYPRQSAKIAKQPL